MLEVYFAPLYGFSLSTARCRSIVPVLQVIIMNPEVDAPRSFRELSLIEPVLKALDAVGYESPSAIQAATIPVLLQGKLWT